MTQIIDGKAIAAGVRRDVAADVAALSSAQTRSEAGRGHRGEPERLADVREHEAQGVCRGRHLLMDGDLPEDISKPALVAEVHGLNADPVVHGSRRHRLHQLLPLLPYANLHIRRKSISSAASAPSICSLQKSMDIHVRVQIGFFPNSKFSPVDV
ncbi:uncharacterized protein [Miscanthus floridulus]|uniref:uncharacterized protein isoform X1 n=1 Tax=Miscanthus floridulus TaxID=154761 RepID=UPI003459D458